MPLPVVPQICLDATFVGDARCTLTTAAQMAHTPTAQDVAVCHGASSRPARLVAKEQRQLWVTRR